MGDRTKEDEPYRKMCKVVDKVILGICDLEQKPKRTAITGVLRTALVNKRTQCNGLEKQAMETIINALVK